jgi:hypothetical protein
MPIVVKRALIVLLTTFGFDVVRQIVALVQFQGPVRGPNDALTYQIIGNAISLFLLYKIYRRRNWARILQLLGVLLAIVLVMVALRFDTVPTPAAGHNVNFWIILAIDAVALTATIALFSRSASMWFADGEREEPSIIHRAYPRKNIALKAIRLSGTFISITLFLVGMTQPAFNQDLQSDPAPMAGGLLAIGWMGILVGYFEWIANPLMLFSWISAFFRRYSQAAVGAAVAFVVILSFLRHSNMVWPGDNGEKTATITGYDPGYWLWLASAAVMAIGSGLSHWAQRSENPSSAVAPTD